ncbi:unnamed protein product, partial [marine sediment metagenome]
MTEVVITPFDNEISILHKWASYFKIPVRLILVTTQIQGVKDVTMYSSGISHINNMIDNENNLRSIYNSLKDKIETEDIVMAYTLLATAKNKTLDDVMTEINKLYIDIGDETVQDVNELKLVLADWRQKFADDFQYDMENLTELLEIHQQLDELDKTADPNFPKVLYSPIKVDKVTIKASPTLKSTGIAP